MAVKIYKSTNSVDEGGIVNFYATDLFLSGTTTSMSSITPTFATAVGGFVAADFDASSLNAAKTGLKSFPVINGIATIPIKLKADQFTESSAESLVLTVSDGAASSPSTAAATVVVNDTSKTIVNAIYPSGASVNEGKSLTFNVLASDGNYTASFSGTGTITTGDYKITSGVSATNVVSVVNGKAAVGITLIEDGITETTQESIVLTLAPISPLTGSNIVSSAVKVVDTSKATYTVKASAVEVPEGASVTFNISGTPDGTYSYALSGTNVTTDTVTGTNKVGNGAGDVLVIADTVLDTAANLTYSALTGTVLVKNGVASVPVLISKDASVEGNETLVFTLSGGTPAVPVGQGSASVLIKDTTLSIDPVLSASAPSVQEGGLVNFYLTNANTTASTYTYELSSATDSLMVVGNGVKTVDTTTTAGKVIGSVTVSSDGTAVIPVKILADNATEGSEVLTLKLIAVSGSATVTTANVIIDDTSIGKLPVFAPTAPNVDEGKSSTFTLSNGASGGFYDYELVGDFTATNLLVNGSAATVTAASAPAGAYSGTLKADELGGASLNVSMLRDYTTEGSQPLAVKLTHVTTATSHIPVSSPAEDTISGLVTINDSSYPKMSLGGTIKEGNTVNLTLSGFKLSAASTYTYKIVNVGSPALTVIDDADFTTPATATTVAQSFATDANGGAVISLVIAANDDTATPDTSEQFQFAFYESSSLITVVGSTAFTIPA
ncbi:MAG: hypothetical protein WCJ11_03440 [Methylococcaceae bacterium]